MSGANRQFQLIQGGQTERGVPGGESSSARPMSFEEALVAHLDRLFAFALRLASGQRERAEDLVQEVCLRAFRNYPRLRSPEKIKPWFFKILLNTYINEFHRQSRQLPIVDVDLSDALLESANVEPPPTPEKKLFQQLLDAEIQHALDALPVEFRAVIWLSDVEELSYKEIAQIINCPMGTVASRLYRGHSLLRERLWEYGQQRGLIEAGSPRRQRE